MSINLSMPRSVELKPRIVVIGVGGAGGNAVNNMIDAGLDGIEFVVANTDAQALALSKADRRIQMGTDITQGLGAGMQPEVGEASAEDSLEEILEHLDGTHMLFVAAGMGGGTGTGAAPVIARAARERGILTVAIVTKPFNFEGTRRMGLADDGLERLASSVDTLIVIPNQNLFRIATETTTIASAFGMADEVLHSGVRSVTDLMVVPGLINLDFADVRTVMNEMGKAMMGTGEATGERRAIEAAESAISNPLLDDVSLRGAKGVLINITGGKDLTLYEVDEAASLIRGQVDPDANIIVGSSLDDALDGIVRVSVVATGVDDDSAEFVERPAAAATPVAGYAARPIPTSSYEEPEAYDEEAAEDEYYDYEDAEDEIAAYHPEPEPAPAPVQTRRMPRTYPPKIRAEAPARQPAAPAPAPVSEAVEPRRVIKNTWGLFGRKKDVPIAQPAPVRSSPANTGDLFVDEHEDELEIPSFLRRQSR